MVSRNRLRIVASIINHPILANLVNKYCHSEGALRFSSGQAPRPKNPSHLRSFTAFRMTKSVFLFKLLSLVVVLTLVLGALPNFIYSLPAVQQLAPKTAKAATYQYAPSSDALPVGAQQAVSATNMGSYKGTLASDDVYWSTNAVNPGGLDKRINIDGVLLNGANKLIVTYEGYVSNAALTYQVQIYDNNTGVWRNLNDREAALSNTAENIYTFEIYDGYWQVAGNPISTPLSNFITADANKRVQLRILSTDSNTYIHYLDRLQIESAIDSLYRPAGMTQISGGAVTNNYTFTYTADNNTFSVANTAASLIDYYFSFKGIQTYPGANSIAVNYEGAVSGGGLKYRLKIYNFTTSLWEDLSSKDLNNTTINDYQFAKSNVNLSDYISSGEVRVGIYATSSNTLIQSTDSIYIMIGSVNDDPAKSEISFGAAAGANNVSATRNIDTSAPPSTWKQSTAATAVSPYPFDWGGTYGTNYSASTNIGFPVTIPISAQVTGVRYAARFRTNSINATAKIGLYDYSGQFAGVNVAGGWTDVGAASSSNAYFYTDGIHQVNPEDYINITSNLANMRLRTSASTDIAAINRDFDFAFVSIRWINDANHPSMQYQYAPTSGSLATGTNPAVSATNMGTYKGTFTSDDVYWSTNAVAGSGLDKRINIDGVDLNGANKLVINYEGYVSNAALTYQVQIYDNVSGTWRNLNDREVALSNTAENTYTYEIYDGYWETGGNPVSTPLSNFITADADKRVQLRIYSTDSNTYTHYLDRLQIESAIDPLYTPAGMTKIAGGNVTNDYSYTFNPDSNNITVDNDTTQPLDYYFSFKGVQFYPGANSILVNYRGEVSNSALTYKLKIFNYSRGVWEDLNSIVLNNTSLVSYQFAKSSVILTNYVNAGEVRVGVYSTSSNTFSHSTDRIYITIGSVNNDIAGSEVSFGSVSGGSDVSATRDLDTSQASTSTWQQSTDSTAAAPYASDFGGTYGTNFSASSNLNLPVTIPNTAQVTGVRYAARFRSNAPNNMIQAGLYDFSGQFTGSVEGGWRDVGSANSSSAYTFTDGILQVNPEDFIDTTNNKANIRLRTASTSTISSDIRDFDFAFVSIRYIGLAAPPVGSLSLSGIDTTWDNVGPLTPPDNNGKGLIANVDADGGNWKLTVSSESGDASGKLYSTDEGPSVYQGTFQWNVDGVLSTPGPAYTTSQTDFLTTEQNVADNGSPGSFIVDVDYALGNPTWDTSAASVTGYSSTHYYTLYYGL